MAEKKLTDKEIKQNKTDKMMHTVIKRASYYRANPQRFVSELLNIHLKIFQKILIYAMMKYDYFYFIAARGIGKTYLVSLFACVRCILYPGTKIVAFSATFKQGKEIVMKITDDFMIHSPFLCNEIKRASTGLNDCGVWFKNGSWIQVRVAGETSRGARSNVIIGDESRMIPRKIYDTVMRPMNSSPRQPGYLNNPKYEHLKEMNKEFMMSSAWYKASEMFETVKAYAANSLDDRRNYFICDLPYQLSIAEGLLMKESIENEMSEETFSEISFMMEREGKFYGSSEDALFKFDIINKRRVLQDSLHILEFYKETGLQIPKKQVNEKRILSLDVALLASKKHDNDASAFTINQCFFANDNHPISNISCIDTKEGLLTEELGLRLMRYFYQYDMDYVGLDCSGIGQAILDYCMQDRYDPLYGCTYKAMTTVNNEDLAVRCKVKDANKCIYAIKASAKQNNDMCLALRAAIQNGYINLLLSENDMDEKWQKTFKGYNKLSDNNKALLKLPYYQTSALIDELINLDHEISNGLIKVKEKSGMRKDRYSSLEYNYYVVDQIRLKQKRSRPATTDIMKYFSVRAPKKTTLFS